MSSLAQLQRELLPIIEEQIKSFLAGMDFGLSSELEEMLTYHMGWTQTGTETPTRGKRIRPLLTLLCHGAFSDDLECALPGAVAVELLHNFTLIHDDIEDHSPLRHGRPTLWKKWGQALAINTGDALFSIAQTAILSLEKSCNPEIALSAAKEMNAVSLHLTQGQHLDIAFEAMQTVTVETYLDMVAGKTAALLAFSTALGGLTARQNPLTRQQLSDFGEMLGLAFQIQDDILGIWGNPDVTGKSAASDLLTRKKSLPVLFGMAHSPEFNTIWSKDNPSEGDIHQMATLLADCGAHDFTAREARRYTDGAFQRLNDLFPHRNPYSEALFELTGTLLNRSV
jgi:geranylgeranyl diphosphate synthase type I